MGLGVGGLDFGWVAELASLEHQNATPRCSRTVRLIDYDAAETDPEHPGVQAFLAMQDVRPTAKLTTLAGTRGVRHFVSNGAARRSVWRGKMRKEHGLNETQPLVQEAMQLIDDANSEAIPLRLLGGIAFRLLCPDLPPRFAGHQDLDLATTSSNRRRVAGLLEAKGYLPARRFNTLHGHRQMAFQSPTGMPVDVIVNQLDMCHTLDLRQSLQEMPYTIGLSELLLSKLQIVELNEKDVVDVAHLLSAFPVSAFPVGLSSTAGHIDPERFVKVLASNWGWWRTVTLNLSKLRPLVVEVVKQEASDYDPVEQIDQLLTAATTTRKSIAWRMRGLIGERVEWYRLPEDIRASSPEGS